MRTSRFLLAFVAVALLVQSESALGAALHQAVARTGQQAPSTAVNTLYSNFSTPAINNVGQVIFSTQVSGGGSSSSNNNVLYAGAPGSLSIVARSGNQAPGLPAGVNYRYFHHYEPDGLPPLDDRSVINDAGQVVFLALLTGTGVTTATDLAVFSGAMGAPQFVAREGTQAPGTPAGVKYGFPEPRLNAAGQVALWDSFLNGPGVGHDNQAATFIGTPGSMQLAARDGDPAPGTIDNYGGGPNSMGISTFNDAGLVAFADGVSGPDVNNLNREAIFAGTVGSMQIMARNGNPAPGAPAGVNYATLSFGSSLNDSGQLVYRAAWTTGVGGVDSTNDGVLYAGPIGSPQVIVREGDPAPGTPAGTNFSSFGSQGFLPILNDGGGIYFEATLTGPGVTSANDGARYAGPLASPRLIAREGDPAADTPAGVVFSSFLGSGRGFPGASFNDAGQVALLMLLAGTGVTAANDTALYLFDPTAGAVKIAREGDLFDVGGGDLRRIADLGIDFNAGPNDNMRNGLGNDGTLVFGLRFTDNTSGIFTASVPVPEPASLLMLALGVSILILRLRGERIDVSSLTRGMFRISFVSFTVLSLFAISGSALRAAVIFNSIVDTTMTAPGHGAFTGFSIGGATPSISGSNVAFTGSFSGGDGIYTGSVGAIGAAKIVDTGDIAPGRGNFASFFSVTPTINGSIVAFTGYYSGGNANGIYTGSVGATGATKIVDTGDTAPGHGAFASFSIAPSVSGSNVVFTGYYSGGQGIYTGSVGATGATKMVDTSNTAPGHGAFTGFGSPTVNGSTVGFAGYYAGGNAVYTGSVGATAFAKIVDTSNTAPGHGAFINIADPSISGSNLAMYGSYSGGNGIYTGTVGATGVTKIVDRSDTAPGHSTFNGFGIPSVSGSNIAFSGQYAGGASLYLASGGGLAPLINTGDPLFDSTVTALNMGGFGLDGSRFAFSYTLADGRRGIAVATITNVPEPATFILAGLGLLSLAFALRKKRSRSHRALVRR